jgi:hypothetical protein
MYIKPHNAHHARTKDLIRASSCCRHEKDCPVKPGNDESFFVWSALAQLIT